MSSVTDYMECPRCKQEDCMSDFNCKTGETFTHCPSCGYHENNRYKRTPDGKYERKDEAKGYEFDNLIPETILIAEPYGAFRIESVAGGASCGTLTAKDDYDKFVSEIVSMTNQPHEIKEAVVSSLVDRAIVKDVVFKRGDE